MSENMKSELALLVSIIIGGLLLWGLTYLSLIKYPICVPIHFAISQPVRILVQGKWVTCQYRVLQMNGFLLIECSDNNNYGQIKDMEIE